MCGIAGWIGQPAKDDGLADELAQTMRHRGPDGRAVRRSDRASLIHTRLSIIDLSEAGEQPIRNEDGTIWAVFNGEIYNHGELRRELEAHGHRFRGRCDAEVLPHLYEQFGPRLTECLRGMFAFAIVDERRGTMLLGRDRFGIKPLFYSEGQRDGRQVVSFASELNALRRLPWVDDSIDAQAMSDFAALSYVPAPLTIFRGIRALEAGTSLEVTSIGDTLETKLRRHHTWTLAPNCSLDLDTATKVAANLVEDAVARQVESDVPLGAMLSGGIDSSLVSAAAQERTPESLLTFSVSFAEADYDETWAANAVAKKIGSRHRVLRVEDSGGSWEAVRSLLLAAGQPYADSSIFAANAVCREMRKHVTVALAGDGGDEGFGGYNLFLQLERFDRFRRVPNSVWKFGALLAGPLNRMGLLGPARAAQLHALADSDDVTTVESLLRWVPEGEHRLLLEPADTLPVRRLFEPQWRHEMPAGASRLERLSALATEACVRVTMASDFLFKVDTASMQESLEVRVPLLDEALFDFGLTLPHVLKVIGNVPKAVLRNVAATTLPTEVARKPKHGFGIPVDRWVDLDFKRQLREELFDPACPLPEWFRPTAYRPLVDAFCDDLPIPGMSREGLYQRVTMLLAAHLCLTETAP